MANQDCQNVMDRIRSLRAEGRCGIQIARVLHEEGCDLTLVRDAFYEEGYTVTIEHVGGLQILHVSNEPMQAGLAVRIVSEALCALPEYAWR